MHGKRSVTKESDMTSKTLKSAIWLTLIASAVAVAAPGGGKGPPEGKGNKPSTEVSNSRSVPAIMAGGMGAFGALACGETFTDLDAPEKGPVFYPYSEAYTQDGALVTRDPGWFYVQRDDSWQAPCMLVAEGTPVDAIGAWGDNLAGDAMLKVGSPIRVELVLKDGGPLATGQKGYNVIKLELDELDRYSAYGHLADDGVGPPFDGDETGPWSPIEYTVGTDAGFAAIVHDPKAWLTIERLNEDGDPVETVYDAAAGGEINATGKIIYGYGLRVGVAGTYRLTYSFTNVNIKSCEEDAAVCGGSKASLDIVVGLGGGGGGGGKGKPTDPGE